jgi:hypothetical protein
MIKKLMGLVTVGLMAGPILANAQTETLDYSDGAFSGIVILSAPLPQNGNDISVSPSEFNFPAMGYGASYNYFCPGCGYALADMSEFGGASFQFTTVNGRISAWDIDIDYTGTPGTNTQTSLYATISPLGDSYTQLTFGFACTPPPGQPSPCQPITVSTSSAGVWTTASVPEIDPASTATGLTLLLGGLVLCRGRRVLRAKLS